MTRIQVQLSLFIGSTVGTGRWYLRLFSWGNFDGYHWCNSPIRMSLLHVWEVIIQVVPGGAGGGSFRRKKNYIAKKEFAYRMCARRPTSAMPKPFLCCERAFCCSMVVMWPVLMHVMSFDVVVMSFDAMWLLVLWCVVSCHVMQCNVMWCALMWCALQWSRCVFEVVLWRCGDPKYYSVLQSITVYYKVLLQYYSVLQSTTTYYSSTTLYYKVLLQYYSVLQSTTPVLLCTTKYYSSATLYYTVLQRTTPVPLCTTKYYSSTTLYCKVLLQHYSALQSTTPVLLCTTQYYNVLLLYYKVLLQYYSVLQSTTPALLCTTKYYSSTTTRYYNVLLQYYSVLKYDSSTTLYYKAAFMIDPRHIWNVIYNARSNKSHTTTSPNTAPATQNDCDDWSASHMKRHLQCAEQQESKSNFTKYRACHANWISWLILVTYETSFTMRGATRLILQLHQILRLPRKITLLIRASHETSCTMRGATGVTIQLHQILRLPRKLNLMINPRHIKRHLQCAEQQESQSNFTKYCAGHAKWISWLIRVSHETSFTIRGATGITIQLHQILPLPRKMNPMTDPHQIWKVIYNARSNQSHPATAANTAPAAQSHSHDSSSSHMKRHLQCAEQHWFPSNITKYCACHEILSSRCQRKIPELLPPIERRFEDNPTMIRAWNRHLAPAA